MEDGPAARTRPLTEAGTRRLSVATFSLEVRQGPDAGRRVHFEQDSVRVGTSTSSELCLTDDAVSKVHAEIRHGDRGAEIIDLGSTNGTRVGSCSVVHAFLEPDATIQVGNTTIVYRPEGVRSVDVADLDRFGELIGRAPKMQTLYATLARVANSTAPVIIMGESGTGKELVARTLHALSPRANKSIEVLDCTAIPAPLVESELFGHVRGAFTGATNERAGVFERAHGGTVFIDELGELPIDLQPKLLRVLERGEVQRVGGSARSTVDVRVVAATHRSLASMINAGTFREDLYYRLAVCEVTIPPLRERVEDIPLLVEHFLSEWGKRGQLAQSVVQGLCTHRWPGNVRQLRNVIQRILLTGEAVVPSDVRPSKSPVDAALMDLPLETAKARFERDYLEALLKRFPDDIYGAARAADFHPKSLKRLLRRHELIN